MQIQAPAIITTPAPTIITSGKSDLAERMSRTRQIVKAVMAAESKLAETPDWVSRLSAAVPRDLGENLAWRAHVLDTAAGSRELQLAFRKAARLSQPFWADTFVWTYNPRLTPNRKLPWICWEYQVIGFREMVGAILRQNDLIIEKSRDMGASWMCLLTFLWLWQAAADTSFFMMSRVSDLVDAPGDPDSLFWKLDFVLKYQPSWLTPKYKRTAMHLDNLDNNASIDGASTTGTAGVGGRRTAAFYDEFPLVEDAESVWMQSADMTNCRIFNGTPNGTNNTFYRITRLDSIKKLRFHWSLHPEKSKGLYYDGAGKVRSPWYDNECVRRGNNRRQIAAQLDIDYQGASYQFFDSDEINRLIDLYARDPIYRGDITEGKFRETAGGPMALWAHLGPNGRPVFGEYMIGCDVATGAGGKLSTPSVASVVNRRTGEKVAEFASGIYQPEAFADVIICMARWFWNARVIWEANGPGSSMRLRFRDAGYLNVYMRRNESAVFKMEAKDEMGINSSPRNKDDFLTEYRRALCSGEFLNRSRAALQECHNFVFGPSGHIEHSAVRDKDGDPSGTGANHSDRVIADALAWHLIREAGPVEEKQAVDDNWPPRGSLAWRMEQAEKSKKASSW